MLRKLASAYHAQPELDVLVEVICLAVGTSETQDVGFVFANERELPGGVPHQLKFLDGAMSQNFATIGLCRSVGRRATGGCAEAGEAVVGWTVASFPPPAACTLGSDLPRAYFCDRGCRVCHDDQQEEDSCRQPSHRT